MSSTCPKALMRVGMVCEQIAFEKRFFPVPGKNAPIPTERPRFGQQGPYCLDLGAVATDPTTAQEIPENAPVVASTSLVMLLLIEKDVAKKVEGKRPNKYAGLHLSSRYHTTGGGGTPEFPVQNPSSPWNGGKISSTRTIKPVEWDGDIYMHLARSCGHRHRVDPFRIYFRRHPFVLYLSWPRVITTRCSQPRRTR